MPEKPECFFGREKELENLNHILENGNNIVFIQGIGGIGKSEIAKTYAILNREKYDTIIYAQYTTDLKGLIASDVEIPIENFKRNTLDEYFLESEEDYSLRKFEALKELVSEKVLLIIDNFNNREEPFLTEFLQLGCKMIFMSRYDWSTKRYPVLNVEEITKLEDIKKIFFHYYMPDNEEEETAIIEIIKMFCGYTLAVEWIAKQLAERTVSPIKVLEELKQKNAQMKQGDLVEGSFLAKLVDIFKVDMLSKEEQEVLRYLCFVPYSGISKEELVRRGKPGAHSAILSLLRNSWIKQIELDVVTLHPVVAEAIVYELKPDWTNCATFIKSIENDLMDDQLPIESIDSLLVIAEKIFQLLGVEDPKAVDLMMCVSHIFVKRYRKYEVAVGLLQKAEELQKKCMEDIRAKLALCKDQDVLDVQYNDLKNSLLDGEKKRCNILQEIGRIKYAIGEYEMALACYMKLSKSPVVDVYCDIAKIYEKVNEFQKAMDYVNAGIKMKKRKYGDNSPELIENYLMLGQICIHMMDKNMALNWMSYAKNIAESELSPEEQSDFYYDYALLLKEMEMVKEALEFDQKMYLERRKRLGENHIDVAIAYGAMAVDYYRLGDYASTLECTLKEIAIRRKVKRVKKRLYITVSRLLNLIDVNTLMPDTQNDLKIFMSDFNRILKENPREGKEMLQE